MSQYRQEGGAGPTAPPPPAPEAPGGPAAAAAGPGPAPVHRSKSTSESEQPDTAGPPSSAPSPSRMAVGESAPYDHPPAEQQQQHHHHHAGPPPGSSPQQQSPLPHHHQQHPAYAGFYGGPKPPDEHGGGHFGPRQPFAPAGRPQPQPHRFVGGPGPPPQGPTPTLNQLLQSNSPVGHPHRYPNSYGHPGMHPGHPGHPGAHPHDQQQQQQQQQHYGVSGHGGQWPPHQQKQPPYPLPGAGGGPPNAQPQPPPPQQYRTQQQAQLSPAYQTAPSPGYGGGAGDGWRGAGGPASPVAPAPSPQPPSHSPGPGGPQPQPPPQQQQSRAGPPPSPQQAFAGRPPPPTTPNAHGPDQADLSGGNSNDSSGGPAPGTPNSQGMRPTPSPTGSTGSRSMSPAVGQNIPMPPRPSSGQSDPGQPLPPSSSPAAAYKGHVGMAAGGGPPPQPQQQPYGQPQPGQPYGGYAARPVAGPYGGYGAPGQGAPPPNAPQQFQGRPAGPPNHMQNSQYPPPVGYQQHQDPKWVASGVKQQPAGMGGGPNGQGPPGAPGSPRPPHYLKHHLQHKMGFGAPPSPGPPQQQQQQQPYHMGPPPHHMGPPPAPQHHPGPPVPPPNSHEAVLGPGPPGPMPPPASTPNSHYAPQPQAPGPDLLDNGITTTAQGGMNTHVTSAAGSVTSVVTTGPDGTPIDEGSQQSTLSNASAASGEDPQCPQTPKTQSGKRNEMGHYGGGSHPATPQSAAPSPGGASMNSMHEDYELSSPGWPRTPASPKTDSLSKLYEMDESPERKAWLDKLLAFMDDRRTPITTCPTISKNPLDLFRLYMYVKDRGGFMEVTKNKTWKDIAGMLGIGASSSAAYTLRKHYTKNLLAYECQFDRGGIDPQPIINQVEASSKKKGAKAASVPSPGSSNSQDSFPAGGGGSMDGYGGYNGYPQQNPDGYQQQRPAGQSAPSPHGAGGGGANHFDGGGGGGGGPGGAPPADNVSVSNPFDDVSSPSTAAARGGQYPPGGGAAGPYAAGGGAGQAPPRPPPSQAYGAAQPQYQYAGPPGQGYPPAVRPVYPPYSGDSSGPTANNAQGPPGSLSQDPYGRYPGGPAGGYSPRPGPGPGYGAAQPGQPPSTQAAYPAHQDYYRSDQNAGYPGGPTSNKNMPPPGPQPPRRHPDFAKDQPYPYGQPRTPMYTGGWPNNNQYRPPQYQGNRNAAPWPPGPGGQGYQASQPGPGPGPGQGQWQPMANQGVGVAGQPSPMRPVHRPGAGQGKPFPPMMGGQQKPGQQQPPVGNSYGHGHGQIPKREITFPPDSVENVTPILYRRKRLCRADVGPVDAWRLIMCLRSGILSESTYALDMLNILLFDDTSVGYFGLNQWPGLLDLLLEHFKRNVADMFDGPYPRTDEPDKQDVDLGAVVKPIDSSLRSVVLNKTTNYTMMSRRGHPVKLAERNEDIFVQSSIRSWDIRGEVNKATTMAAINRDPWYTDAEHILPNFQAEFGRIPFHTRLEDKKKKSGKEEVRVNNEAATVAAPPPKISDRKRSRTKTLSDVISRIKKDCPDSGGGSDEAKPKTEGLSETSTNCDEAVAGASVDLKVNGECDGDKNGPIHDPAGSLKRRRLSDFEDEAYSRDEASLVLLTESQDNVGKRSMCISNILRSLTFIPGNEGEFAKNTGFLALAGKILLLHHEHPARTQKTRNYDREEDGDFADSCSSLQGEAEWWWEFLAQIRENVLVCVANIAGQVDVSSYEEEVARPLLDGLLHWAVCPAACAQDPFPAAGGAAPLLSPQRLALEALCKLCVTNGNVDLVLATPPFARLERLCAVLTKNLCRSEDQVLREFSVNLLHYLAAADSGMARVVASQPPCVSLLVAFIEQAEASALGVANQHGIGALRDNPDSMGTSLDMLRRAAATLVFLARHPANRPLLRQHEPRLLALVMSQILDQQVALLIAKVLFQISRGTGPMAAATVGGCSPPPS